MFYQLPEAEAANRNTVPLLDSIMTLRNLHTVVFRTRNLLGKCYGEVDEIYTYNQIRNMESHTQATGFYRKLELIWPEDDYEDSQYEEVVAYDLCAARPDVCIMFEHGVPGAIGCLGACKEDTYVKEADDSNDESDSDDEVISDYDSDCDCTDQDERDAIAIREPHQTRWRFVDDFVHGGSEKELEKQVFAHVEELEV